MGFSSSPHEYLSLSQGEDIANIHNALNAMTHMSGGTKTSAAIEFTSSNLFTNDQPNAKRVMIVLTDGQSGDFSVLPQAKAVAASHDITMMSVGVGSGIGLDELEAIADKNDYVFTMSDFNELVGAVDGFSTEVCEIINLLTASPSAKPTASTSQPTRTPSLSPSVACTVENPLDLVFVVDGSGSVGTDGFDLSKQFVGEVADRFTISPSDTRIGIVQFSSSPQEELTLSQGDDIATIHNTLNAMTHMGGGTQTSLAIEFTSLNLFTNDRPNAKRVMIVLTDGQSGDFNILPQAKAVAASQGITMMSVGVGSGIGLDELIAIADQSGYVFTMNDFNELVTAVDGFSTEVCEIINLLTASPSAKPTSSQPTVSQTNTQPTTNPSFAPTTAQPTENPTQSPSLAPTTAQPTENPTQSPSLAPTVIVYGEVLASTDEETTNWFPWVLFLAIIVAICIVCTCWFVMDDRVCKFCCACCVCCINKTEDEDEECPVKLTSKESGSRLAQLKITE